jgi:hypothetical protein
MKSKLAGAALAGVIAICAFTEAVRIAEADGRAGAHQSV